MAIARSGYGRTHYTDASADGGAGYDTGPTDYLAALLRQPQKRRSGGAQRRGRAGGDPNLARQQAGGHRPSGGSVSGGGGRSQAEKQLPAARARAELIRLKAAERPAPATHRYSGGVYLGHQPDYARMNAYEREMFMPQSSRIVGDGGPSPAGLDSGRGRRGGGRGPGAAPPSSARRADFFGTGSSDPASQDQITRERAGVRDDESEEYRLRNFLINLFGSEAGRG